MPFPFTFNFTVPGLSNPFSSLPKVTDMSAKQTITRPRPSPSPGPPLFAPTSRKRGWEPAFVEPSLSTTTLASSSGYLDTPAKYRDMALAQASASGSHVDEFHEADMIASDIGVSSSASPFVHALHVPSGNIYLEAPSDSVPFTPTHSFSFFSKTYFLPCSPFVFPFVLLVSLSNQLKISWFCFCM